MLATMTPLFARVVLAVNVVAIALKQTATVLLAWINARHSTFTKARPSKAKCFTASKRATFTVVLVALQCCSSQLLSLYCWRSSEVLDLDCWFDPWTGHDASWHCTYDLRRIRQLASLEWASAMSIKDLENCDAKQVAELEKLTQQELIVRIFTNERVYIEASREIVTYNHQLLRSNNMLVDAIYAQASRTKH